MAQTLPDLAQTIQAKIDLDEQPLHEEKTMAETLYKIRREDGTELPGAWPLAQAKARARGEAGACTFIACTLDEQKRIYTKNLRFVLGWDDDEP